MTGLCIFDCDGTLVDSLHAITEAMALAFRDQGLAEPAPMAVKRLIGLPLTEAVAALLDEASDDLVGALAASYRDAYAGLRRAGGSLEPLFPGIVEVLDALQADGWRLAIATGKSRRGVRATLGQHGLLDRFVSVQTPDTAAGKPSPDMVYRALAETGVEASATVVVGDTAYDMMMASNAGVIGLGVAWGYHDREALRASGALAVIEVVGELTASIVRTLDNAAGLPALKPVVRR